MSTTDDARDSGRGPALVPDRSFDGGDLDCGNGLLLLIRKHIDPLDPGSLLEIRSTEISVDEDLPAWCRLTGNALVSFERRGPVRHFLIRKGESSARTAHRAMPLAAGQAPRPTEPPETGLRTPQAAVRPPIPPLAITCIGSWPRPAWMIRLMHDYVEGRLDEQAFQQAADDAVRLALASQERAGVHIVTDGEQRRDSYASFIATRLENCQLVPLTDLLPLVDDPEAFASELRALDVPAHEIRHPAVFGRLRRRRPIAVHELDFASSVTDRPVKVALPGPYLLARTMWMECLAQNAYTSREQIAADIVTVLREEAAELLEHGAAMVQFDEPVLSEVVFSGAKLQRSFMCGALSESLGAEHELAFARELLNAVTAGLPRDRIALHVCRGNWTADESCALSGGYEPLIGTLAQMQVGAYLLEMCTPRAGEMAVLRRLPDHARIGVGVVNQKTAAAEPVQEVTERIRKAIDLFGLDRVLLHPDCGFATFADNPVATALVAEAKLRVIDQARRAFVG